MGSRVIFATLLAGAGVLTVSAATTPTQAHGPAEPAASSTTYRVVNITTDSAPGWIPSQAQEQQALAKTNEYYTALDAGQYQQAYAMMADVLRSSMSLAEFTQSARSLHDQSGHLIQRNVLKVTWTKDPASAPFPCVYVAIDIAASFAKVDRYCGYVVLYQEPSGGDFVVMREEQNFIDNASAERIEREKSRVALDQSWATLDKNCPNYTSTAPLQPGH